MNGEDQPWGVGCLRPVVPEHELVRCIGEGSYGQVWLARSSLGEWRAVKLVPVVTAQSRRSYEREFTGVRRFEPLSREDEGFVDILQTGQDATGDWFYYVMELADDAETDAPWRGGSDPGRYVPKTLSRVLRTERRMPVRECVVMGLRLVRALGRLHSAGLLHRDVKPSNVVLIHGQAKLADIGLVVDQSEARSYVGTDGYIPPEGPNTPQADIYGLGMVLYEAGMGMGQESFPVANPEIRTDPDAPLLRELNAVVLRACAGNPAQRYASAQDLEEDLALLKDGGSVRQRRRWIRGRRLILRFGAVAAMAAVFVWVLFPWILRPWMSRSGRSDPGAVAQARHAAELQVERGNRLAIDQDPVGALLWHVQALPLMEPFPEQQQAHRVRIGQILDQIPQLHGLIDCGSGLHSVALSADAERVATADRNGDVAVWDSRTGQRVHGPYPSGGNPVKVRFSPDGTRLLLAPSVDAPAIRGPLLAVGSAVVIDAASGRPVAPAIGSIAWGVYSPDGSWIAVVKPGNEVWLHAVDGSVAPRLLAVHAGPVGGIEFSPDGSRVGSCASDGIARVWNLRDASPASPPLRLSGSALSLAFSPDSKTMATVARAGTGTMALERWDLASGQPLGSRVTTTNIPMFLRYDPESGRHLLLGTSVAGIALRDARDVHPVAMEMGWPRSSVRCWTISPQGRWAAAGGAEGAVQVWDLATGRPITPVLRHARSVEWIRFNGDGSRLLAASVDGLVRVWELSPEGDGINTVPLSGQPTDMDLSTSTYPASMDSTGGIVLMTLVRKGRRLPVAVNLGTGKEEELPDDTREFSGEAWVAGNHTRVWAAYHPTRNPDEIARDVVVFRRDGNRWDRRRIPQPAPVVTARFSRDDRHVITLGFDRQIRRWDAATGGLLDVTQAPAPLGASGDLSHDGRMAWLMPGDQTLHLCDPNPQATRHREVPLPERWQSVRWLGGSDIVMGNTVRNETQFWDDRSGTLVVLPGIPSLTRVSVWHEGSRRILGVDGSGVASVIELAQGLVHPFLDDYANLQANLFSFSPSGRFVVAVGNDKAVHVQEAVSGLPIMPGSSPQRRGLWAAITPDDELIVLADPPMIRRWRLAPAPVPDSALPGLASALSGRQIDEAGHVNWIHPAQLAQTAQTHRDPRIRTGRSSVKTSGLKKISPIAK